MKKVLVAFIAALFCIVSICAAGPLTDKLKGVVAKKNAVGGGGEPTYYYSYGGSATSYTTCDDFPSQNYHNGGIVTVTTGGTATSFGVKVNAPEAKSANICLYNSTGSTGLACCTTATIGGSPEWIECTGKSVSVDDSTNYLVLWTSVDNTTDACRCSGGADCAVGNGKFTTDAYNATCTTGCPAPVAGLDDDTGYAVGVRIYVE